MKTSILTAGVTVLIFVGAAFCQSGSGDSAAAKTPVVTTSKSGSKPEIGPKTPKDWIVVQDQDYIPVIDDVSRKLQSARNAFMMRGPAAGGEYAVGEVDKGIDNLGHGISGRGQKN